MANYLLCNKEFKCLGTSYIELADIKKADIETINIETQFNFKGKNCNKFLEYGNSYIQKQKNILVPENVNINEDIEILIDADKYYFYYEESYLSVFDKLTFNIPNTDNKLYCIVTDIDREKHYIHYFNNFEIKHQMTVSIHTLHRYKDMKENTNLYELFIEKNNNSLENNIIPFFMPEMEQTMDYHKKILIHVSNEIDYNFSILITSHNNNYINNLYSNDNFYIEHTHNKKDSKNYTSYYVSLLYNGDKSWFII